MAACCSSPLGFLAATAKILKAIHFSMPPPVPTVSWSRLIFLLPPPPPYFFPSSLKIVSIGSYEKKITSNSIQLNSVRWGQFYGRTIGTVESRFSSARATSRVRIRSRPKGCQLIMPLLSARLKIHDIINIREIKKTVGQYSSCVCFV